MSFPVTLDTGSSLPNPSTSNNTNNPSHAGLHGLENAAIIAAETKLGTGASTPASNTLLIGTGTGTSAWSALTSSQLAAILSDETGTGSAVFANTPVLVTPKVDTINENTGGNGVTVGGVNLKSGVISTAGAVGTTSLASGIQVPDKMKNPYKFFVYRNAALTVNTGAFTKISFDTKLYDTGSNFDTVTNFQFTAPIAGFYQFAAGVGWNTTASLSRFIVSLYKNGTENIRGGDQGNANGQPGTNLVAPPPLQLAINDTVDVRVQPVGANTALLVGATPLGSYYGGFLVSAT